MKRKAPATPRAAKLTVENARTGFSNCRLHEEGIICARLGLDRNSTSSLVYDSPNLSVSALVRKGKRRRICQDAAMVLICDDYVAAGVFDGYGRTGTLVSETSADLLVELFAGGMAETPLETIGDTMAAMHEPEEQPVDIISAIAARLTSPRSRSLGGSTATVACLRMDGGFHLNSISDSAAYKRTPSGVSRLLKYHLDTQVMNEALFGGNLDGVFFRRDIVHETIRAWSINPSAIECDDGFLDQGQTLLLVTDGVTKNFTVRFDPETMKVTDTSGSGDLHRILRGRHHHEMIPTLVGIIDRRVERDKDLDGYRRCNKDTALYPADDDLAIVAITRH